MKTTLLLATLLASPTAIGLAQNPDREAVLAPAAAGTADQTSAPVIQLALTNYDFGKVKQGETVKHAFIFTNMGASALEITNVKTTCGCTTADVWDRKVEPGKTGSIPLQFNSAGFVGKIAKSVAIRCNDPLRPQLSLVFSRNVWQPIDIRPTTAMFQVDSENQTNDTKTLRIVSNVEEPVTISDVRSTHPQFTGPLTEVIPGKEFELRVSSIPPFTNATAFGQILLKTSSAEAPNLKVSAYVTVQPQLVITPRRSGSQPPRCRLPIRLW